VNGVKYPEKDHEHRFEQNRWGKTAKSRCRERDVFPAKVASEEQKPDKQVGVK
jgi:hypothetical protein